MKNSVLCGSWYINFSKYCNAKLCRTIGKHRFRLHKVEKVDKGIVGTRVKMVDIDLDSTKVKKVDIDLFYKRFKKIDKDLVSL